MTTLGEDLWNGRARTTGGLVRPTRINLAQMNSNKKKPKMFEPKLHIKKLVQLKPCPSLYVIGA